MTRLLLHSYHFPPIGGSGAQRPLKMVRALRRLGYESVVVTGGGATTDPWAPEDATLARGDPFAGSKFAGSRAPASPSRDAPGAQLRAVARSQGAVE